MQELGVGDIQSLQVINILRVDARENPAVLQQFDKVVSWRGFELPRKQLLGKLHKRHGIQSKIIQAEDSLWGGQVVFLQVVVQTCARRAKIGDAGRNTNPCGQIKYATHTRGKYTITVKK